MEGRSQPLIQKALFPGRIPRIVDADQLRESQFDIAECIEPDAGLFQLHSLHRRMSQRKPETRHFEDHVAVTAAVTQPDQIAVHRINPPERIDSRRIALHGLDGNRFSVGSAETGRIGFLRRSDFMRRSGRNKELRPSRRNRQQEQRSRTNKQFFHLSSTYKCNFLGADNKQ